MLNPSLGLSQYTPGLKHVLPTKHGESCHAQDPDLDFRDAFMEAVHEYNSYGAALNNNKWRIDETAAVQMYGFKAQQNISQ